MSALAPVFVSGTTGRTGVVESGLACTILQPCRYMQHLYAIWCDVVVIGVQAMPLSTRERFSVVDLADLAAAVASDSGHRYTSYELAGSQPLDQEEMAEIIAERVVRPVTAGRIEPELQATHMAAAGAMPERVSCPLAMNRHDDAHGLLGNANVLRSMLRRTPTTFVQYVARLRGDGGSATT